MNRFQYTLLRAVMALLNAPALLDGFGHQVWEKRVTTKRYDLMLTIMPHCVDGNECIHLELLLWCRYSAQQRWIGWSTNNARHDVLAQVHDAALGLMYGLGNRR